MKKIMFSNAYGLTTAAIQGTKTRTWRKIPNSVIESYNDLFDYDELVPQGTRDNDFRKFALAYAPYKVGDILAVAQPYSADDVCNHLAPSETVEDAYFIGLLLNSAGWTNKMFVKSSLMPHQIEITGITIQKCQDLTDEQCFAEGIYAEQTPYSYDEPQIELFWFCGSRHGFDAPLEAFSELLDRTCGKGTFDANPYGFAIDFKLIK